MSNIKNDSWLSCFNLQSFLAESVMTAGFLESTRHKHTSTFHQIKSCWQTRHLKLSVQAFSERDPTLTALKSSKNACMWHRSRIASKRLIFTQVTNGMLQCISSSFTIASPPAKPRGHQTWRLTRTISKTGCLIAILPSMNGTKTHLGMKGAPCRTILARQEEV